MNPPSLSTMTLKKLFILATLLIIVLIGSRAHVSAQDKVVTPAIQPEHADDAPLAFPPLEHYAKLWENSMFTTKSLPPPDDAPKGPIFTDNLTLVGIYEVDGAVAGVVLDRTTSLITEVRIGAENEQGVKIARVNPGSTPDKTRLQLQKGDVAGWVSFAVETALPAGQTVQGAPGTGSGPGQASAPQGGSAIPGRPVTQQPNMQQQPNMAQQPNMGAPMSRGNANGIPGGAPPMRSQPAAPPPQPIQQSPVIPVTPAPAAASGDSDIPLPPQ